MKISHKDALKILGCSANDNFDTIKWYYRRACAKYHPDRNYAGTEMMKLVNASYASLQDYVPGTLSSIDKRDWSVDQGDKLNAALNAIIDLAGINIEICGSWIWVSGDTKTHKDVLKQTGFKYAPQKKMWSYCAGRRTTSRGRFSMDDIRTRHGSTIYVQS